MADGRWPEMSARKVHYVKLRRHGCKTWQKVDGLIEKFYAARARCGNGNNPVAKEKLRKVRSDIREMTAKNAELSSVALWCVLQRNDPQLSRLIN
jgi:hypothetical protein